LDLKDLRDKLEELGLTRSRGFRIACKYLVKVAGKDHYWAWITIDSLAKWRRRGYRVVLYAECDSEDIVLKIAELLVKTLEKLRREGYA